MNGTDEQDRRKFLATGPATLAASLSPAPAESQDIGKVEMAEQGESASDHVSGKGRMTVFFNGGKARTADFTSGDVGYVPKTFGHYIENTGDTDLVFLEMFRAERFQDLSLCDWVAHASGTDLASSSG